MSQHYFSADPTSPDRPGLVRVRAWGHDLVLRSASGVFARDRLDLGTAVLLRQPPPVGPRKLLDLGCGYGAVACALAVAAPEATVWAVDVNRRALELTRSNAAATGVADRVQVARPEDVPGDLHLDEIWSNPPIRIGKPALHGLLEQWLDRLTPTGAARLVVSRHLGADSLQGWLLGLGWSCRRVASAKGYRVLEVRRA